MSGSGTTETVSIQFGAFARAIEYGEPCGDMYYFQQSQNGLLFTLIDGLGHGEMARHAAVETVSSIKLNSSLPIKEMAWKVHRDIRSTRGCVAFIGRISLLDRTLECTNIGNITCKLYTDDKVQPISRPGILGNNLKKVFVNAIGLDEGDSLVLCSDGVSSRFELDELDADEPEDQTKEIIHKFSHSHDDASALIVRVG